MGPPNPCPPETEQGPPWSWLAPGQPLASFQEEEGHPEGLVKTGGQGETQPQAGTPRTPAAPEAGGGPQGVHSQNPRNQQAHSPLPGRGLWPPGPTGPDSPCSQPCDLWTLWGQLTSPVSTQASACFLLSDSACARTSWLRGQALPQRPGASPASPPAWPPRDWANSRRVNTFRSHLTSLSGDRCTLHSTAVLPSVSGCRQRSPALGDSGHFQSSLLQTPPQRAPCGAGQTPAWPALGPRGRFCGRSHGPFPGQRQACGLFRPELPRRAPERCPRGPRRWEPAAPRGVCSPAAGALQGRGGAGPAEGAFTSSGHAWTPEPSLQPQD